MAAIEAVCRLGKPVAEVGNVAVAAGRTDDLQREIRDCLRQAGEHGVKGYMRPFNECRWTYGFFCQPWALDALAFLDGEGLVLSPYHRDWISGLLFGYNATAIQEFLSAESVEQGPSPLLSCAAGMEGTFHPCSEQSHSRSPSTYRFLIVQPSAQ